MSVSVRPVTTKKEMKQFICFNYELYKGSPYAVPDLYSDVRDTLDPNKNAAFEFCEAQPFIALRDGKVVGRIVAVINKKANQAWDKKSVRFGWVDFIDDAEVVDALFAAVEEWGRERGMDEIHGPLGFTDFDPEGMLVEGFDRMSTMVTIYNHAYYPEHMERMGYTKDTDWVEYMLTAPQQLPERHTRIARIVKEKFGLRVVKYTSHKKLARERGQAIFELLNEAYANLYGYSALSPKQIQQYIATYLPLLDLRLVPMVVDKDDNLIGFALVLPSLAKAFQKANGRLFPFGWWHLIKALKWNNTKMSEMMLIAVKPEYQGKGAVTLLFEDIIPIHYQLGYRYSETNPELETNTKVQAQWDYFERENHKRRRIYAKKI
ncbi:MAG: GNAT family N-acetyltransferase [Bacteroidaceae bacterium]|nr:GNAT family N-acetyltransferase [Bacteroidaceae bacterium]MBR5841644.1 GNAT family N-acetyltransferase [Bacteroidaceae bacterium]